MKKCILCVAGLLLVTTALAQTNRVGVGTTTPRAGLDVVHNDGLIATGVGPESGFTGVGPGDDSNLPSGTGTRMMWIPKRGAFRAGTVKNDYWNMNNVGSYSAAFGGDNLASGTGSTAAGFNNAVSGNYSTALGEGNTVSSMLSFAAGTNNTVSGSFSAAIGSGNTASGSFSYAIGSRNVASGSNSTAIGNKVSTNENPGSMILGDVGFEMNQGAVTKTFYDDEFVARFRNGFTFITSYASDGSPLTMARIGKGGSGWEVISDSTKKEGFRPADGQAFLRKIAAMRLGSWNYRGQDAKTFRHYGPMAQDFFAAFGRDGVGTIGNDTSINGADFDGVNLIAIKALIQENEALKARLDRLEAENKRLTAPDGQLTSLRADVEALQRLLVANTGK